MKLRALVFAALLLLTALALPPVRADQEKLVIYRSEQTGSLALPSLIVASLHRPDFIELPLMLSHDDVPVVYDDLFLHPQTNVADIFPDRAREDGQFYFNDFTLAELEQLTYRRDVEALGGVALHPSSLADALRVLTQLGEAFELEPMILPVIKYPWFHRNEKRDISAKVLETIIAHTDSADALVYLKCFDPEELQRIHKDLLPGLPVEVRLIQGLEGAGGRESMRFIRGSWESYSYEWLYTRLGLRVASGYAYALSLRNVGDIGEETLRQLIADSQALKMKVFVDAPANIEVKSEVFYEKILYDVNADGLAVSDPAGLNAYLNESKQHEPALSPDASIQPESENPEAILSDPDTLSERLRKMK